MNRIVIKLTRKSLFSCRIRRGRHFHPSHRQPHSGETWRKKRGKSRWWQSYSYKVHNGKTRCLVYERNEGSLRLWARRLLKNGRHHLRAVFHLQITFVEVRSSVSTTHHVLFFVTLVLAIGSIVNGTLLQIHFFYGCLRRKCVKNRKVVLFLLERIFTSLGSTINFVLKMGKLPSCLLMNG